MNVRNDQWSLPLLVLVVVSLFGSAFVVVVAGTIVMYASVVHNDSVRWWTFWPMWLSLFVALGLVLATGPVAYRFGGRRQVLLAVPLLAVPVVVRIAFALI